MSTVPSNSDSSPRRQRRAAARFAVFDLDRTITKHGTFTAFLLSTRRTFATRAALMLRILAHMVRYKTGRMDRLVLKNHMLETALRGMSQTLVERAAEDFAVRIVKTGIRAGFSPVLARHREAGDMLVMATASIDLYASLFASHFDFDLLVCTTTAFAAHGPESLRIVGPNCYGAEKQARVAEALLPDCAVSREEIFVSAYSDDLSDMPLLKWANDPSVVCPRRKTRALAVAARMKIEQW